MFQFFKSLAKTLNYLLNSKSTSLLTSSKPRPPLVRIDSLLISWGLLSGEYMNDGSVKFSKLAKFNQIFNILFVVYFMTKSIVADLMADNSIYLIYIGDVAVTFMDVCPRIYFHLQWISISIKTLLISIYFYVNQNNGKLCWLETTQLTKGLKDPEDISLTIPMAEKYWHRLCLTKFIVNSSIWYTIISVFLVIGFLFLIKWPEKYLFPYGIQALLSLLIWIWYMFPHSVGTLCIFHQMCYYLNLRFDSVNKSLENLLPNSNPNNINVRELKLILREHNLICVTVKKYNDFWRIVLLSDALIHAFFVLVMIYLTFFSPNPLWIRIFFSTLALMFMSCLLFVIISAASVSTQAHKSYALLNIIFIKANNIPLITRIQLQQYIERIGGPKIGFFCGSITVITKSNIVQPMFTVIANYLVFLQFSLRIEYKPEINPEFGHNLIEIS